MCTANGIVAKYVHCLKQSNYVSEDRNYYCSGRQIYRLVGVVVKASASRAEDPGFESRLRRDFFGVESYQ